MSQYSLLPSILINLRPKSMDLHPVVAVPQNGSSITPPFGQPAIIGLSIKAVLYDA